MNPTNRTPSANLSDLFVSRLSGVALGTLVAESLDPAVATDAAWRDLLAAIEPKAEDIAKNHDHLERAWSAEADEEADSAAKIARRTALLHAFSLSGEAGQTVESRFSQTFGSEEWIRWAAETHSAAEAAAGFISELVDRRANGAESPFGNKAILPLLRFWLTLEYADSVDALGGSAPLAHCLRRGLLDDLLHGEILDGAIRQAARFHRRPWDPQIVALLEAKAIQREIAASAPLADANGAAPNAISPEASARRL